MSSAHIMGGADEVTLSIFTLTFVRLYFLCNVASAVNYTFVTHEK